MSRRPRVYLAIGTFYAPQRLGAAVDSLVAWGVAPNRLWRVAPARADAPAPDRPAGKDPQGRFELRMFPPDLPDGAGRGGDEAGGLSGLCLSAIMAGNAGADIRRHVETGATVLVAGTEGADLHDQCVKVLLRHSLHTVHTQDVGVPA